LVGRIGGESIMPMNRKARIAAMQVLTAAALTLATPVLAQEANPTPAPAPHATPASPTQPAPSAAPAAPSTAASQPSAPPADKPSASTAPTTAAPAVTAAPSTTAAPPATRAAAPPAAAAPSAGAARARAGGLRHTAVKPALVRTNVHLRSGPGTNAEIVATIPGGSTVRVGACNGEWCEVTWNGRRGFAIAQSLVSGVVRPARAYRAPPRYVGEAADEPEVVYGPRVYYAPPPVVYGPAYYRYYGPGYYYRRGWWGRW
jgi:uncharacterized protein YraI